MEIKVFGAGGVCVESFDLVFCWTLQLDHWVKLRGELNSAVSQLGLKWGSFMVPGLGILWDSGKKLKQGTWR